MQLIDFLNTIAKIAILTWILFSISEIKANIYEIKRAIEALKGGKNG